MNALFASRGGLGGGHSPVTLLLLFLRRPNMQVHQSEFAKTVRLRCGPCCNRVVLVFLGFAKDRNYLEIQLGAAVTNAAAEHHITVE